MLTHFRDENAVATAREEADDEYETLLLKRHGRLHRNAHANFKGI